MGLSVNVMIGSGLPPRALRMQRWCVGECNVVRRRWVRQVEVILDDDTVRKKIRVGSNSFCYIEV